MSRRYSFYLLDVFTEKMFCGNPLSVFPKAEGLTDEEMQAIAREMNLSETVFVLPSEKALRKLRIFTPVRELPLAGHPVVGTWNLLATLGVTPKVENGVVELKQELTLGVLPVEIEFRDSRPFRVTMTQGRFEAGERITNPNEIKDLAAALGLQSTDFDLRESLPIQVVSTGLEALVVPILSLAALSRCRVNAQLLSELYLAHGAGGCYAFTFETIAKDSKIHARYFAPSDNIAEDAATGSAAGALASYLVCHSAIETNSFTIEQGDFMKRPSRIFAEIVGGRKRIEATRIAGSAVIALAGELSLEPP